MSATVLVAQASAWLLTYALHSTILLGAAWLLTRWWIRSDAWRDVLWKTALVGGIVTATAQLVGGWTPAAGRWTMPVSASAAAAPAAGPVDGSADAGSAAPSATAGEVEATPSPPALATRVDGAAGSIADSRSDLARALLILWAVVAAGLLGRLGYRHVRLLRLLSGRVSITDHPVASTLAALRRRAGYFRPVRLTSAPTCPTPLALGAREICVPRRFMSELAPDEQESALAHELAHLARRDPLWHLLAGVIESVFFFQPLNGLARRRLRESAEHLADDWAVRQTGSAMALARCLSEVAAWVAPGEVPVPEGTMAMAEGGSPLVHRVRRLLNGDPGAPVRRGRRVLAATMLLTVVAAAPVVSSTRGAGYDHAGLEVGEDSETVLDEPAYGRMDVAPDTSPKLLALLDSIVFLHEADVGVQREAVESYGRFTPDVAVPRLRRVAWEHPDGTIRKQAAETMGEVGGAEAMRALIELIDGDAPTPVQRQAVESIAELEPAQAEPVLRRVLATHPRTEIRREALDQLTGLLDDGDPDPDIDVDPDIDSDIDYDGAVTFHTDKLDPAVKQWLEARIEALIEAQEPKIEKVMEASEVQREQFLTKVRKEAIAQARAEARRLSTQPRENWPSPRDLR